MVDQQLARGELLAIHGLILLEPVHYLLSTVQIRKTEGPCRGNGLAVGDSPRAPRIKTPAPGFPHAIPTSETGREAEPKHGTNVPFGGGG